MAERNIFDHVLFALLLALPLVEWRWTWPRFLARLGTGEPGVRGRFYRGVVISQWSVVLPFFAYWYLYRRPLSWLLLGWSTPLRLGIGLAVGLVGAWFLYWQRTQIMQSEEGKREALRQLESASLLLPHGMSELRLFRVVSVTAGVCEEILFRGFLLWYLAGWTGMPIAVILSSSLFGLGHIYMGAKTVPKTAGAGVVMSCLALAAGSLWPAILIHAAMDWNSGELGYRLIGRGSLEPEWHRG